MLQDGAGGAEEAVESGLILDESCSGILFAGLDRHTEDWSIEPRCVSLSHDSTFTYSHGEVLFHSSLQLFWLAPKASLTVFQSLNDSESEEVLNAINPNEMYTSALSESDSGLSEDQYSDEQNHSSSLQPPAVYQVVYDISGVGGVIAEQQPPRMDVISIELGERFLFLVCVMWLESATEPAHFFSSFDSGNIFLIGVLKTSWFKS